MEINKNTIQEKLVQGQMGEAIGSLLTITKDNDSNLYSEVVMLSARYNALESEKKKGLVDDRHATVNQNRIYYALTDLITKISPQWSITISTTNSNSNNQNNGIKKILFLEANPKDTKQLRIGEEVSNIEEGLKRSNNRDSFKFVQRRAVQIKSLSRALMEENPNIIHFSGHGSKDGRIILEDSQGLGTEVNAEGLSELFELFKDQIECVILNACYSEYQAQEIAKHINYVIGMSAAIPDKAAIAFSEAFYDGIANGRDIEFSFKLAQISIKMYNLKGDDVPVLIRKFK